MEAPAVRISHAVLRFGSLIAVAASLCAIEPAWAQDAAEAAKKRAASLLDEGNAFFAEKQYEAALGKYEAAYEAFASPKILLNIAEAQRNTGNIDRAADRYEQFLRDTEGKGEEKFRQLANERLAELVAMLGTIALDSSVEGAEVRFDGQSVGRTPVAPLRVMPGRKKIEVHAQGYEPWTTEVMVRAGKTERVAPELRPLGAVAAAPVEVDQGPSLAVPTAQGDSLATSVSASVDEDDESLVDKWWFWAGIGAIAIGTTVAVVAATSGGSSFVPEGELGSSSTATWESFTPSGR